MKLVLNLTQNLEGHCKVVADTNDNDDDFDESKSEWDRHDGPDAGVVFEYVFSIPNFIVFYFLSHCLLFLLPEQWEVAHHF